MVGSASALTYKPDTFSGGSVKLTFKGNVAIVRGYVKGSYDEHVAIRAAKDTSAGTVINLIARTN